MKYQKELGKKNRNVRTLMKELGVIKLTFLFYIFFQRTIFHNLFHPIPNPNPSHHSLITVTNQKAQFSGQNN